MEQKEMNWTKTLRRCQIGSAVATASIALAFAAPASALEIGDMFDWLVADGGDGGSGGNAGAIEEMVVATTFLPDTLPPAGATTGLPPAETIMEIPYENDDYWVDVGEKPRDRDGAAPVPEPSAALLFGIGAFALSQRLRRRR
jgi:hypothetical protein